MTVIAVPEAPPIICPSWCVVTQAEHVASLGAWEGRVIHMSPRGDEETGCDVSIATVTYVDGTPDPAESTMLFINDADYQDGTTLEAAEQFARQILATIKLARA